MTIPVECGPQNDGQLRSSDSDGDYVLDDCDPNPHDGPDADLDGDGVLNAVDNCPSVANPDQAMANDERGVGVVCDERLGAIVVDSYQRLDYLDGPFCSYLVPTIVGTEEDDVLRGTNGRDVIWAGGGNDRIIGGNGNDVICGGAGDDTVQGGNGNDLLLGGSGADRIEGGNGSDELFGEDGDDELFGGNGKDRGSGGRNADLMVGGNGKDSANGDANDTCEAEATNGC